MGQRWKYVTVIASLNTKTTGGEVTTQRNYTKKRKTQFFGRYFFTVLQSFGSIACMRKISAPVLLKLFQDGRCHSINALHIQANKGTFTNQNNKNPEPTRWYCNGRLFKAATFIKMVLSAIISSDFYFLYEKLPEKYILYMLLKGFVSVLKILCLYLLTRSVYIPLINNTKAVNPIPVNVRNC